MGKEKNLLIVGILSIAYSLGLGGYRMGKRSGITANKSKSVQENLFRDVNDDGRDDLCMKLENGKYNVFIGQDDGTYIDIDRYLAEREKDLSYSLQAEREKIMSRVAGTSVLEQKAEKE